MVCGKFLFYIGCGIFFLWFSEICVVGIGELLVCIDWLCWLLDVEGFFDFCFKWLILYLFNMIGLIIGCVSVVECDVMMVVLVCWLVVCFVVCNVVV